MAPVHQRSVRQLSCSYITPFDLQSKADSSWFSLQKLMHPRTCRCLKPHRAVWLYPGRHHWLSLRDTASTTASPQASQKKSSCQRMPPPMSWQIWSQGKNTLSFSLLRRADTRASLHMWRHPRVGHPELPQVICWLWVVELCIRQKVWMWCPGRNMLLSSLTKHSLPHWKGSFLVFYKTNFTSSCQSAEPSSLTTKRWLLSISSRGCKTWRAVLPPSWCFFSLLEWCAPWNPLIPQFSSLI